jgi:competence protein ComEC
MLPFLTAAFFFGLLCGSQLSFFPISIISLLVGVAVGSSILERIGSLESRVALLLYASLLSGVMYWSVISQPPQHHQPSTMGHATVHAPFTGRIIAPVQHSRERQTILVDTEETNSKSRRIRLVWRDPGITLHHGDRILFHGTVHHPRGSLNPGGFDYAAYLDRQGVDFVTTVTGTQAVTRLDGKVQTGQWSFWSRIDRWRDTIRTAAINTLSQPTLGLFLGMIIGERGYLEQELQEWFMATGTVHLLSISGSHLGLVAVVAFWMVKKIVLWLPPTLLLTLSRIITPSKVAILLTWPVVAFYALLAGAELATIRSLVMITLAMVAVWIGYERHLGHAMAVALMVIVLHDPRAIFDISFQLSFLSVLVMIKMIALMNSWSDEGENPDRRIKDRVMCNGLNAFVLGGSLAVATLPMVAFYFNQVPWMGAITNLVAVPFTGLVLVPLGLLSALWTIVTGADSLIIASGLEHLFRWMVLALRWCAHVPGAEWHIAAPSIPMIALFYSGVLLVSAQGVSTRFRVAGAGMVIFLIGWWSIIPGLRGDGDHWRVTFLDVGQGDSAVVELPDGRTVLIDGGARYERFDMGRSVVAPFLWNRGIQHIDYVIGTHQQLDHVGGLIWVLQHMSVGQYWGGGVDRSERFVEDLKSVLHQRDLDEHRAVRGQDLVQSGLCRVAILNPTGEFAAPVLTRLHTGTWLNNQSIVLRLQCGAHSVLFAADIETDGLRRLSEEGRQPVTVLKVPHHGARSSLDYDWLRQIRPQYAVVSVGAANPYGHPVESVLQDYESHGSTVYRTDLNGAVWMTGQLSTSEFTVTSMRDVMVQPVDLRSCLWRCEYQNWRRLMLQVS